MSLTRIQNLVDGQFRDPSSGKWFDNVNPATGEVYSLIPDSDESDVELAVVAARGALPQWAGLTVDQRATHLERVADVCDQQAKQLALAETTDNGKPLSLASTVDIPRVGANLRFFASMIRGFASESHAMPDGLNYTLRQPLGVVGCITPWNLPLYLFTWKIAPALAAGNCVIGKPSELTPMTAYLFSKICIQAGLPPGVLNVIHGYGSTAGDAIVSHKGIKAVSFTGGTKTGGQIASRAAPMFKKFALEMGGKNPNIVFADCDYEKMMDATIRSSFANQGQICLCGSRIFVEKSIYNRFREDFVQRTKQLTVGDPLEQESNLGAVVSYPHQQKILGYIELAKSEGGTILCGGKAARVDGRCSKGFFVEPTVVDGLSATCRTNQEEIFGPVVTLIPFEDDHDAIAQANSTDYGLSASVWTNDLSRGHRVAQQLESGVVWVNCWMIRDLRTPFGGMKSSGVGREGGLEALRFWTEPKNVCVQY